MSLICLQSIRLSLLALFGFLNAFGYVLNVLCDCSFPQCRFTSVRFPRVNLFDPYAFACLVRPEQEVTLKCGADNVLMTEDCDIGIDAKRCLRSDGCGKKVCLIDKV